MSELYRLVFGYDRGADLDAPPLLHWSGQRVVRDDAPRYHPHAYSLNTSVVLSELGDRARRPYGPTGLDSAITEEERKYGIPQGTFFAQSAERSRRGYR